VADQRYITFSAGKHRFAVPIEQVNEVVSSPSVLPVPGARSPLEGIIRYRDRQVLPVFSLLEILGETQAGNGTFVLVAGSEGSPVGYRIRRMGGVIMATGSEEEAVPYEGKLEGPEGSITGVLKKTGGAHILLEIGKMLDA
jgi:chemotaxis signal transduction protein